MEGYRYGPEFYDLEVGTTSLLRQTLESRAIMKFQCYVFLDNKAVNTLSEFKAIFIISRADIIRIVIELCLCEVTEINTLVCFMCVRVYQITFTFNCDIKNVL